MTWFESVAAGLMAGLVGIVSAALVAFAAFRWFPFTGLEGASASYIGLNALLGGVLGLLIGILTARAWNAWGKSNWKAATSVAHVGGAAGALVALIAVITASVLWLLADIPPEIDGQRLDLEVELRLPAGDTTPPSEYTDPQLKLYSVVDRVKRAEATGTLRVADARRDDSDRWIIPGSVFLFTTRGQRLIEAHLGGEIIGSFTVPLPGSPGNESRNWSEWLPKPVLPGKSGPGMPLPKTPDKNAKAPPPPPKPVIGQAGKPAIPEIPNYRYRVTFASASAGAAARKPAPAAAKAPLAKPEPTLAEHLAHTRLSATDAERDAAIAAITAKPGYVDELSALMLSPDNRVAADAMYVISKLPPPPPAAFAPGVIAAGQDVAARLDRLNASSADAAAQMSAAADITIRFAAWMDAVRVLRRSSGANFIPDLVAILERSRVRTDNVTIQHDVRRVASRFAKEWGGVPPQPDDPPW